MDAHVTAANVHEKVGAKTLIAPLSKWLKPHPILIHVDGGYSGRPFAIG
jgi:hypothetical protein